VVVHRWAGSTIGLDLTVFSFDNDLEYRVEEASFMDPADAHGAYTVGAIFHGNCDLPDPPLEAYSSQGPTTDGRPKPDIVAFDGTSSFTYGPEGAFGTSFAAPVAAGAAAVFLEHDPSYEPGDLVLALAHAAFDVGEPGLDPVFGAGELQVEIRPDCDDGVDNDGDGLTDVDDDPGCLTAAAMREDPACSDGVDNDGDGMIDWDGGPSGGVADPQCGSPGGGRERVGPCGLGAELALILPPLAWLAGRNRCKRG
jgi:hypothetical protein